jgi:hypothetical protein
VYVVVASPFDKVIPLHQQNVLLSLVASWSVWKLSDQNPWVVKLQSVLDWSSGYQMCLGALVTNLGGYWITGKNPGSTWKRWRQAWEHLEVMRTTLGVPWSASNKSSYTNAKSGSANNKSWCINNQLGSAKGTHRSTDNMSRSAWERQRQPCELTQVSVSLSKLHHTLLNVEEG